MKVLENTPTIQSLVTNPTRPDIKSVPVKVIAGSNGPLTFKQKVQSAYKAIVAFVGTLLTLVSQIQSLTPFLPEQYRHWIGLGLTGLTLVSTLLTTNQKFVESL